MRPPPTEVEVRDFLKTSVQNMSVADLDVIRLAELENQRDMCRMPVTAPPGQLTDDLYAAILRRCARHLAARGVPMGYTAGGEQFGASRLPSFDAEIERLEGPKRKFAFG